MNKYEKAYSELSLSSLYTADIHKQLLLLKELVERATPKKPINTKYSTKYECEISFCPDCNDVVFEEDNYCIECGKPLDWSDK